MASLVVVASFCGGVGLAASTVAALSLLGKRRHACVEVQSDSEDEVEADRRRLEKLRDSIGTGDISAGFGGFSMEDARMLADVDYKRAVARTPSQVVEDLQCGNARFWMGVAMRPEKSAFERRALISKQFPSTAVLGCSDSRVPVELVFDQGLGDMFVIRVAGNCLDTTTLASLQYAIHHLKVKVLLVLGHEGCGAVKAAGLPMDKIDQEPHALGSLLGLLKSGLDEHRLSKCYDVRARDREAVVTNVRQQLSRLCRDEGIAKKVLKKELVVLGGFYEITSGIVDFFAEEEIGAEELPVKLKSSLLAMKGKLTSASLPFIPER